MRRPVTMVGLPVDFVRLFWNADVVELIKAGAAYLAENPGQRRTALAHGWAAVLPPTLSSAAAQGSGVFGCDKQLYGPQPRAGDVHG